MLSAHLSSLPWYVAPIALPSHGPDPPPAGPCRGLALVCPHPHGGAQCPELGLPWYPPAALLLAGAVGQPWLPGPAPDRRHGETPPSQPPLPQGASSPHTAMAVSSLKWVQPYPSLSHLLLIIKIICFATLHASKHSRHSVIGFGESPKYPSHPEVKNVKIRWKWRKCSKMICY